MRGTLAKLVSAVTPSPAEPESAVFEAKAAKLRARLARLDEEDARANARLAEAQPRFELELAEEEPDGPARREVAALRAGLAARATERNDIRPLVAKLEAAVAVAKANEAAEAEEAALRALADRHEAASADAVAKVAEALVALGRVDGFSGAWGRQYDDWIKSGGVRLSTAGLDVPHVVAAAKARAPQLAPCRFNPPARLIDDLAIPSIESEK